jgi:hypothetical protein
MVLLDPICQLQNHPEEGVTLRDVGELEVKGAALWDRAEEVEVVLAPSSVGPSPDRQG